MSYDNFKIDDSLKHLNIEPEVPSACQLTFTRKSEIGKEIVFPFYALNLYPRIDGNIHVGISARFNSKTKKVFIDACEQHSIDIDEFKLVHFDPNSICRKTLKYDKVVKTFKFQPIGFHEISCEKRGDKPAEIAIEFSVSSIEIIDPKIGE